jgi:hypothetical protein
MTASDSAHERDMKVRRREVLGDEHVDAVERTTPLTADFQDLITWSVGRVARATRMIVQPKPHS